MNCNEHTQTSVYMCVCVCLHTINSI